MTSNSGRSPVDPDVPTSAQPVDRTPTDPAAGDPPAAGSAGHPRPGRADPGPRARPDQAGCGAADSAAAGPCGMGPGLRGQAVAGRSNHRPSPEPGRGRTTKDGGPTGARSPLTQRVIAGAVTWTSRWTRAGRRRCWGPRWGGGSRSAGPPPPGRLDGTSPHHPPQAHPEGDPDLAPAAAARSDPSRPNDGDPTSTTDVTHPRATTGPDGPA